MEKCLLCGATVEEVDGVIKEINGMWDGHPIRKLVRICDRCRGFLSDEEINEKAEIILGWDLIK